MAASEVGSGGVPLWRVEMLGRLRARRTAGEHAPLEHFQTRRTALLFALLALRHGGSDGDPPPFRRDELAARLWPDADDAAGRDRLSQALSWLRRHLEADLPAGAVLRADRETVRLAPGAVATDVAEFSSALDAARAAAAARDPARQAALLEAAADAYAGPLLPGLAEDDDGVYLERQRLATAAEEALRDAVLAWERTDTAARAADCARRLRDLLPDDEDAAALLMRALARAGDWDAALRAYADFARRREAAGEGPPPPALKRLADELRVRRSKEAELAGPPLSQPEPPAPTLPPALNRFFGREEEMARLLALIGEGAEDGTAARLVTLLGPGGTGKTRLAVETARRAGTGAVFVPLEGVAEAAGIFPAVARALGGATGGEDGSALRDAVTRRLAGRPHLLVLDNAEHLAGRADTADVLTDLLRRAPEAALLVTSRRALGLDGEQCVSLAPLPVPFADLHSGEGGDPLLAYPSVALFLDRARRARLDFALTPANRDAVAALCARLEGLPLALELCAAWAATLTLAEMLAELDDRFALLVSRRADVPERHRSMSAAVETSYEQLLPDLRESFALLSVFRGGWTAPAAAAVLGVRPVEARDRIVRLQERSLVVGEEAPGAGMRFRMLDTLREFTWGQAADDQTRRTAAGRHAAHFLTVAEDAAPRLTGPEQSATLAALDADRDNLRAALAHLAAAGRHEDGLRLASALELFWIVRGYLREGRKAVERFLAGVPAGTAAHEARGRAVLGSLAWAQGDLETAWAEQQAALALWRRLGDTAGEGQSLFRLGVHAGRQGRHDEADALLSAALAAAESAGDDWTAALTLLNQGNVALERGDTAGARAAYGACLRCAEGMRNDLLTAGALNNLGNVALREGDAAAASEHCSRALALYRRLGSPAGAANALMNLAEAAARAGDRAGARSHLREAFGPLRESGARQVLVNWLSVAASVAASGGEPGPARDAVLLGALAARREEIGAAPSAVEAEGESARADAARRALGDAGFEGAFARGRALSLEDAITLALPEI